MKSMNERAKEVMAALRMGRGEGVISPEGLRKHIVRTLGVSFI